MGLINHNTSFPNDGLGDELRDAFTHQNTMNAELYDTVVFEQVGKDLSTNDFTDALKTKLLGIEDSAEVNVQSDWSQSDNTADDYIKNKPVLNNYVNTIGFFDYNNDNTTPLTLVADTEKKLTNDCVGTYTNIDHPTHGVTRLFDPTTNNIVLDELGVGDLIKLRVDINVTTATANQVFKCILRLGIGTTKQFEIIIHEEQIKDTGPHQRTIFTGFYVGSEEVRLALGELVLVSDHAGSVVVNGFFFEGIKRNVNFIELSGGGGTTPTLQEVALQGDEIINSAGNLKIVLDKEVNGVVLYELVSGTWEERGRYTSSDFKVGDGTGNYYILGSEFTGFSISQGTDIVQITPNSITKNGVEVVTTDQIKIVYENEVKTLSKNADGQFSFPHGSVRVGNKFYIGTREGATSKLLRYNELTLEESITIPCTANIGLESLCTDGTRLYGIRHNSGVSYIFDCALNDFTDIQYNTISGVNLAFSPAIITDGTYIYGVENVTSCKFFKIRISDWSTIATNNWTGINGGHGGKIDVDSGVAYFTSQTGYFAKVNLSNLTYTQIDLRSYLSIITDDLAFCPSIYNDNLKNYCVVGGEYRDSTIGKGGVIIDADDMVSYPFDLLPTYGLFFNNDYTKLYSCSNVGFIEEMEFSSFLFDVMFNEINSRNTYTFRQGGVPNEMFFNTDNEPYCTNWKSGGNLFKIEITPVDKPLITEKESYYRNLKFVPTALSQLSTDSDNQRVSSTEKASYASKVDDAPNNANAYVRSALGWVIGYTKSAIDTLLGNKADKVSITGATKTKVTYNSQGIVTSGADATTADISDSTDKRYQTDVQRTNNDATSSIQTQLNNKQNSLGFAPYRFIQTSQTAHTGTTSETIVATATISGGTFNSNDVMKAIFKATKASTTSNVTMRLRINTTNSLSGATQVGLLTFTTANLFAKMKRDFDLQGGNLYGYNFTSSIASDDLNTNTIASSIAYNTANTLYMFWTLQLGTSGDSVTPNLANLTN